jgi:Protein of unknown function (DUF2905)
MQPFFDFTAPRIKLPVVSELGKILTLMGLALAAFGLILWALGRSGFRGLPGDIRYQGSHFRFYFPWVTCLVVSLIATALMWLWHWFGRK